MPGKCRPVRLRVDLAPEWHAEASGRLEPLKMVLDMLRYSGLLENNVRNFPRVIEYDLPEPASPQSVIARSRSFGITAEIVP